MKSPIVKIKNLLKYLPERDISIGERLLNEKNIESLKELVDSAYYLTRKNQVKEIVPKKYQDIDIEGLRELKTEVDNYHSLLTNILGDEEYESELDGEVFDLEIDTI